MFQDTVKLLETIPDEYSFELTDNSIAVYKLGRADDYKISEELKEQLLLCFAAMKTKINQQYNEDEYSLGIGYSHAYEGSYISFDYSDQEILYVLAYAKFDMEPMGGCVIGEDWYYYDFASV